MNRLKALLIISILTFLTKSLVAQTYETISFGLETVNATNVSTDYRDNWAFESRLLNGFHVSTPISFGEIKLKYARFNQVNKLDNQIDVSTADITLEFIYLIQIVDFMSVGISPLIGAQEIVVNQVDGNKREREAILGSSLKIYLRKNQFTLFSSYSYQTVFYYERQKISSITFGASYSFKLPRKITEWIN